MAKLSQHEWVFVGPPERIPTKETVPDLDGRPAYIVSRCSLCGAERVLCEGPSGGVQLRYRRKDRSPAGRSGGRIIGWWIGSCLRECERLKVPHVPRCAHCGRSAKAARGVRG